MRLCDDKNIELNFGYCLAISIVNLEKTRLSAIQRDKRNMQTWLTGSAIVKIYMIENVFMQEDVYYRIQAKINNGKLAICESLLDK